MTANKASAPPHMCDPECLDARADGWFQGRCDCGWVGQVVPDLDILVDDLMEHARVRALIEDKDAVR